MLISSIILFTQSVVDLFNQTPRVSFWYIFFLNILPRFLGAIALMVLVKQIIQRITKRNAR
jgi:hypothetical protein